MSELAMKTNHKGEGILDEQKAEANEFARQNSGTVLAHSMIMVNRWHIVGTQDDTG
jgi:hypothetical protein